MITLLSKVKGLYENYYSAFYSNCDYSEEIALKTVAEEKKGAQIWLKKKTGVLNVVAEINHLLQPFLKPPFFFGYHFLSQKPVLRPSFLFL